jgi:hypothetical protein
VRALQEYDRQFVEEAALAAYEYGSQISNENLIKEAIEKFIFLRDSSTNRSDRERWSMMLSSAYAELGAMDAPSENAPQGELLVEGGIEQELSGSEGEAVAKSEQNPGNSDIATLEKAIVAHGQALSEITRERAPLDWAKMQYMGNSSDELG